MKPFLKIWYFKEKQIQTRLILGEVIWEIILGTGRKGLKPTWLDSKDRGGRSGWRCRHSLDPVGPKPNMIKGLPDRSDLFFKTNHSDWTKDTGEEEQM